MKRTGILLSLVVAFLSTGCRTVHDPQPVRDPAVGHEIVACSEILHTRAPVVLWTDPGGYDATSTAPRFQPQGGQPLAAGLRYEPGRIEKVEAGGRVTRFDPDSTDLEALREVIDLIVLHYDACGTSRQCFRVLHDQRGLSAHFLVDLDGTVYQTLDLSDQAWHASHANWRSIGIEIANLGAYPPGTASPLDEWYVEDFQGTHIRIPGRLGETGLRTRGFEPRPARPERIVGEVQGELFEQYDLTPEQYDALVDLVATLCQAFPRVAPDAPRDALGRVRTDALTAEEQAAFHGIVGHYHLTEAKRDPGPAFAWGPFLELVHARVIGAPQP